MKTTSTWRPLVLAGLLLLSLLALALAAQAAPAINASGTGAGGGDTTAVASVSPANAVAALVKHGQIDRAASGLAAAIPAQPASSGGTATALWIVLAVVAATAVAGAWVILRRGNRQAAATAGSAAFCALHPDDASCA